MVLDAAQSAGQIDLAGIGANAWLAPSRKWLRGPRGVGFVAVAEPWRSRLDAPLEAKEGPIAARLGFGVALEELEAAGPGPVAERVAALGALARRRLDGLDGWRVGEPVDEPSGLVTLRHDRHDPVDVQRRLQAAGVLTSAVGDAADMEGFALRAAFHADADESDLDALAAALEELPSIKSP
jgi:pyridoxal 5-phosphate dependent beta-lyase